MVCLNEFPTLIIRKISSNKCSVVLADAVSQSPRPEYLITEGGIQSNHVRQVAAAGAKLGFKSVLIVADRVPERTASANSIISKNYKEQGNVQLTDLMSATREIEPGTTAKELLNTSQAYWIPSGASTHPLGGLGYARWAFELMRKEEEMGVFFDSIIVPSMSGSTIGGMAAGFALAEQIQKQKGETSRRRRLIGVAAGPKSKESFVELVSGIIKTAGTKIGLEDQGPADERFEVDLRWHGGGYGKLDDRTKERIKLAASTEGLITDAVYSGKALTGVCEMVEAGELEGNVLFVHTGGVLSLSAYPDLR